jgi:hypothetical protein
MSTVILDTITGKSTATTITIGSTPVVSASANSMTIRGEGSNQTSIQQGLCKAWLFGSSSAVLQDSFNISTPTDHGTGDYSYTLTNPFSNDDYSLTATANSTDERRNATENGARSLAGTLAVETSDAGSLDNTAHNITAHGDLA